MASRLMDLISKKTNCTCTSKVELTVYLLLIYLQLVIHETYVQLRGEEQSADPREARIFFLLRLNNEVLTFSRMTDTPRTKEAKSEEKPTKKW